MTLLRKIRHFLSRQLAPVDPRVGQGALALQVLSLERWAAISQQRQPSMTFSIITATRNRPEFLVRAAQSVRNQSHPKWQWIIVNDGDAGSCEPVLGEYVDDPSIALLKTNGVGLAAARNRGLEAASGDVIVYLDDDNQMYPTWLMSLAWSCAMHPLATWGYGARIVETPEVVQYDEIAGFPYLELPQFSMDRLRQGNYIDANTIFHRRGDWRFDPSTKSNSDWELILQLARGSEPLRVPAIACLYSTTHDGRMSRGADWNDDVSHIRTKHQLDR